MLANFKTEFDDLLDANDPLQVLVVRHDLDTNLYWAYQKVINIDTQQLVAIRQVGYRHYFDILNNPRFHFATRDLAFVDNYAKMHHLGTVLSFAMDLDDFRQL